VQEFNKRERRFFLLSFVFGGFLGLGCLPTHKLNSFTRVLSDDIIACAAYSLRESQSEIPDNGYRLTSLIDVLKANVFFEDSMPTRW